MWLTAVPARGASSAKPAYKDYYGNSAPEVPGNFEAICGMNLQVPFLWNRQPPLGDAGDVHAD
jgi:hypothetical protein